MLLSSQLCETPPKIRHQHCILINCMFPRYQSAASHRGAGTGLTMTPRSHRGRNHTVAKIHWSMEFKDRPLARASARFINKPLLYMDLFLSSLYALGLKPTVPSMRSMIQALLCLPLSSLQRGLLCCHPTFMVRCRRHRRPCLRSRASTPSLSPTPKMTFANLLLFPRCAIVIGGCRRQIRLRQEQHLRSESVDAVLVDEYRRFTLHALLLLRH